MTNLTVVQGDTINLTIPVYTGVAFTQSGEAVGIPADLSDPNMKVWFTAKASYLVADDDATIQAGTTNTGLTGVQITDGFGGIVSVAVDAPVLSNQTAWFMWDAQLQEPDGTRTTIDRGRLALTPQVTRATA